VNPLWVILVTATTVFAGTSLCFWMLYQVHEVKTSTWILEHILCPIIRIVVLLIIVSQVYPAIETNATSADFWNIVGQQGQFGDLLNILFIAGLMLAFIPVVNHPVFALPLQSMLTIALVFHWQYIESISNLVIFPSAATILKIVAYMLLTYFVTRQSSIQVSRWIDHRLAVSGSIRMVSDAIYLLLQIPVMLIFCDFLKAQLS